MLERLFRSAWLLLSAVVLIWIDILIAMADVAWETIVDSYVTVCDTLDEIWKDDGHD